MMAGQQRIGCNEEVYIHTLGGLSVPPIGSTSLTCPNSTGDEMHSLRIGNPGQSPCLQLGFVVCWIAIVVGVTIQRESE